MEKEFFKNPDTESDKLTKKTAIFAKYWSNISNNQPWDKDLNIFEKDEIILHFVLLIEDNISASKPLEKFLKNIKDREFAKLLKIIFDSKNKDISNIEKMYQILKENENISQQQTNFNAFRSVLNTLYPSPEVQNMKNFCNEKLQQIYFQKLQSSKFGK